ncbi:MAG TPA: hypothetical protein VLB68_11560 [Pyrinomonadaceae bacterium]|nr:hypothetical protein [Pyrinomonadaceae bacterium]
MYHLLPTCLLTVIAFGVLTFRYRVEAAYCLLASLPTLIFLIGMGDEYFRGIQRFNHRLLHLAYDGSYALLILGMILLLRAMLKRKLRILVAAGTCVAGIPIGYLFFSA